MILQFNNNRLWNPLDNCYNDPLTHLYHLRPPKSSPTKHVSYRLRPRRFQAVLTASQDTSDGTSSSAPVGPMTSPNIKPPLGELYRSMCFELGGIPSKSHPSPDSTKNPFDPFFLPDVGTAPSRVLLFDACQAAEKRRGHDAPWTGPRHSETSPGASVHSFRLQLRLRPPAPRGPPEVLMRYSAQVDRFRLGGDPPQSTFPSVQWHFGEIGSPKP